MSNYIPPFTISNRSLNLMAEISYVLGKVSLNKNNKLPIEVRKVNRLKSIHSSCAIEQNTLSIDEVVDVINGRKVLAAQKEIQEIKNCYVAYELIPNLKYTSKKDLLKAHYEMTKYLIDDPGKFRKSNVGVFSADSLIHLGARPEYIENLIDELLKWLEEKDINLLIASCVFHFEFEIIHPFVDGNGRMGRLWQTLILSKFNSLFEYLPIETLIRKKQEEYYNVINHCQKSNDSTLFIEFMLDVILETLKDFDKNDLVSDQVTDQVRRLLSVFKEQEYSFNQLMKLVGLKHRDTFRKNYIYPALKSGLIEMTIPEEKNSPHQKYRLKVHHKDI